MKLLILSFIVLIASCGTTSILTPKPGTYPCGINGVQCDSTSCCPESHVCGGGLLGGCSEKMCCFVGEQPEYAYRKPIAQFPAKKE